VDPAAADQIRQRQIRQRQGPTAAGPTAASFGTNGKSPIVENPMGSRLKLEDIPRIVDVSLTAPISFHSVTDKPVASMLLCVDDFLLIGNCPSDLAVVENGSYGLMSQ
jgi:hypothetical protein